MKKCIITVITAMTLAALSVSNALAQALPEVITPISHGSMGYTVTWDDAARTVIVEQQQ